VCRVFHNVRRNEEEEKVDTRIPLKKEMRVSLSSFSMEKRRGSPAGWRPPLSLLAHHLYTDLLNASRRKKKKKKITHNSRLYILLRAHP
jgi:hypothetical protein